MSTEAELGDAARLTVDALVAVGVLVVVPLGLRLIDGVPRLLVRWWPVPAAAGVASLVLPRGPLAVALAAAYALATAALAGLAAVRALRWIAAVRGGRPHLPAPVEAALVTGLACPLVAGSALVAERGGYRLFGFELDILALTVPHLHYAGFVAALVAGLVCSATRTSSRLAAPAALLVPVGTLLVLIGYFVSDAAELAGAAVLTAGMWLVAWLTWTRLRPGAGPAARVLLGVSSAVLAATMLLALSWALGEATGLPHPSLDWMVATHGVTNALGFAVCGVLAWRLLLKEERS